MDVHAAVEEVMRLREAGATKVTIDERGVDVEFGAPPALVAKPKRKPAVNAQEALEDQLFPDRRRAAVKAMLARQGSGE